MIVLVIQPATGSRQHYLACSDYAAPLGFLELYLSSLLSCLAETLLFWLTLSALIASFLATTGSCFQRRSFKKTLTLLVQHQTAERHISDYLVNMVEHLAAK